MSQDRGEFPGYELRLCEVVTAARQEFVSHSVAGPEASAGGPHDIGHA